MAYHTHDFVSGSHPDSVKHKNPQAQKAHEAVMKTKTPLKIKQDKVMHTQPKQSVLGKLFNKEPKKEMLGNLEVYNSTANKDAGKEITLVVNNEGFAVCDLRELKHKIKVIFTAKGQKAELFLGNS